MTVLAKTAEITATLVEYEGPKLLLLASSRNRHLLAIAVRREGMREPFFGGEIPDRIFDRYIAQKGDLHYALSNALQETYYFFDLAKATGKSVKLIPAKPEEVESSSYWPKTGFFAHSHTAPYKPSKTPTSSQTFKIDGKWAANDFSHFHGKMSDLYALFAVLERLDQPNSARELGFMRQAIQDRFWRGGGSYVSFYDSLESRNQKHQIAPLEVERIQYASPGEIELSGNKRALADISDVLELFEEKSERLADHYRVIRNLLKKEKLLGAGKSRKFQNTETTRFVRARTKEFLKIMGIDRADEIYEACEKNTVVFAKVVLSIFRRANQISKFQAEGRIQVVDLE